MTDLKLDLKLLGQLRDDLSAIVKEFKGADDFSDDVAEATGHDGLHDVTRDFAHKWNDKRKTMTEDVENLQKQLEAITDGFTQIDGDLAKALEDANASSPSPVTAN